MENKIIITFNKTILKNIYKSFLFAIPAELIWNTLYMYFDNQNDLFYSYSLFGTHFYNEEFILIAIKDLFTLGGFVLLLIITFVFWIISIINHFVKFKIK